VGNSTGLPYRLGNELGKPVTGMVDELTANLGCLKRHLKLNLIQLNILTCYLYIISHNLKHHL